MNVARILLGASLCFSCVGFLGVSADAQTGPAASPPAAATTPPAAAAPPPPTPVAFEAALLKAANDLFTKANLSGSPDKLTLVIDPFGGHFTANYGGRDAGKVPPVPRWLGTDAENKLNAK